MQEEEQEEAGEVEVPSVQSVGAVEAAVPASGKGLLARGMSWLTGGRV